MKQQKPATPEPAPEALLADFDRPDLDTWRREVERLLKGAPYAKKMFTDTLEGIRVAPLYTQADLSDDSWAPGLPGAAPYRRGGRAAGYHAEPWWISQELRYPDAADFNAAVRADLTRGQTAVNLIIDASGHWGQDPDQAPSDQVGAEGTSIVTVAELATALEDVDLAKHPLIVQSGTAALPYAALLLAVLKRRGLDPAALRGCLGNDPICGLARMGTLPLSVETAYDELAVLSRWAAAHAPRVRTIPLFEDTFHDGGADSALGLGLTLATGVQALRELEQRGVSAEETAARVQFNLEIGRDFFMEIAKVRALRVLWSDVLAAAGCAPDVSVPFVHARTGARSQTLLEPHGNMLRATTQAMSAVLGGVDSLHVSPFDSAAGPPDEFSRRIARNVQLILARECHLDQVTDPAGGCWYVESLTRELAERAWGVMQEVEAQGGPVTALKSGWVQDRIAAAAKTRADRLAVRKDILIGTNQYCDPAGNVPAAPGAEAGGFHSHRQAVLEESRRSESHEEHLLLLDRLEKIMESDPDELMERMTAAAEAGATIGELAGVLRHDTDPQAAVESVVPIRCAAPFENLRRRVAGMVADAPSSGRVFLACLGNFARYMPRLEFTRRFLRVGGFEPVGDGYFTEVDAAVAAFRSSGTVAVVLVGMDDTYGAVGAELSRALQALPSPPTVMLAGKPAGQTDVLAAAGVEEFLHVRSDILEVLARLADRIKERS